MERLVRHGGRDRGGVSKLNGSEVPGLQTRSRLLRLPSATARRAPQAIVHLLDFKHNDVNQLTREKISESHVESPLTTLLVNLLKYVNCRLLALQRPLARLLPNSQSYGHDRLGGATFLDNTSH